MDCIYYGVKKNFINLNRHSSDMEYEIVRQRTCIQNQRIHNKYFNCCAISLAFLLIWASIMVVIANAHRGTITVNIFPYVRDVSSEKVL